MGVCHSKMNTNMIPCSEDIPQELTVESGLEKMICCIILMLGIILNQGQVL